MVPRRSDVAKLAQVPIHLVLLANKQMVTDALTGKIDKTVLEVATQEPAYYWQVGDNYYLDDVTFGDVINFTELGYNSEIGLYDKMDYPNG